MKKILARILSILFHPVLMPLIGLLILFNSNSIYQYLSLPAKKVILIIVALGTIVLPLTFVPFYVFQKIIRNIKMETKKERLIPFFVTFILYVFCYYLLIRLHAPEIKTIINYILVGAVSTLILFALSFKWKISAHMTGIGALLGSLIAFSFILKINLEYYIILSILVSGLLGFARLTLESHKPFEIYTGWLLGLLTSTSILFLL